VRHYVVRFASEAIRLFGLSGEPTEEQKRGMHRLTDPLLVAAKNLKESRQLLRRCGVWRWPGEIKAIRAVLIHGTIQECGIVIAQTMQSWDDGIAHFLDDGLDDRQHAQEIIQFVFSVASASDYVRLHFLRLDAALNNGTIVPAAQVDNQMYRSVDAPSDLPDLDLATIAGISQAIAEIDKQTPPVTETKVITGEGSMQALSAGVVL
jgi:hypothetical protein